MLVNFQVKNFCSFQNASMFSMIASPVRRHPSHLVEINGHCILKSAFIFGANAGGKSNFVRAISFARRLIVEGADSVNFDRRYFRLSPKGHEDAGVFQFTLFAKDHFYEFGLAVSYEKASIISEWLAVVDDEKNPQIIYSGDWAGSKPVFEIGISPDENDLSRLSVYKEDARNMPIRKRTFLSEIAEKGMRRNSSDFFSHFESVYQWFSQLVIIFPGSTYRGMWKYVESSTSRTTLGAQLNHFDTGIRGLEMSGDIGVDKILTEFPEEDRSKLKADLIATLTGKRNVSVSMSRRGIAYLFSYKKGRIVAQKMVSNHGRKDDLFERKDESDGTRRLFDLLPLQTAFSRGVVAVVDELDRSLHTKATLEFIDAFFKNSAGNPAQLIATTHDGAILNLDLLRQDEIWFVERGEGNASSLYPLSKFKERFDKDILRSYMIGRYGALPIFRSLATAVPREKKDA